QAGERVAVLAERDRGFLALAVEWEDADRVAPRARDTEQPAGRIDREPGDDELVLTLVNLEPARLGQVAVGEAEGVHDVEFAAAGVQGLAVGGETQAVEGLAEG